MQRILYLVHNLSDPAVARRVSMLAEGGADVQVAGFRRADAPPPDLSAETVIELDITHDARMVQRLAATVRAAICAPGWARSLPRPDVIVARNLEMLAVASRLRGVWGHRPKLVYECLDIHRLMLRQDRLGRVMRGLEQRLMRGVDLLVTSSPAFLRNHFAIQGAPPALLVENKVFAPGLSSFGQNPSLDTRFAPIRIGWFGALRCDKSLKALDALSRHFKGQIEVDLRGRPALTAVYDFFGIAGASPHMAFGGPFHYPDDLAEIYSRVHFVWAIDFFEEGLNSSWLLPNRLYEGCLSGAIPIALKGTETAAFLERLGIGVILPDIRPETLVDLFDTMTPDRMYALAAAVAAQDRRTFYCDEAECVDLVGRLSARSLSPLKLEAAA